MDPIIATLISAIRGYDCEVVPFTATAFHIIYSDTGRDRCFLVCLFEGKLFFGFPQPSYYRLPDVAHPEVLIKCLLEEGIDTLFSDFNLELVSAQQHAMIEMSLTEARREENDTGKS
jgi:hypothetical protein